MFGRAFALPFLFWRVTFESERNRKKVKEIERFRKSKVKETERNRKRPYIIYGLSKVSKVKVISFEKHKVNKK